MEDRLRRRKTGKSSLEDEVWGDKGADRRAVMKMSKVWKLMNNRKTSAKYGWVFCEECYRICRKRDIGTQCEDKHLVWSIEEIKRTYPIQSAKELMAFLVMRRNDGTGNDGEAFVLPQIPREKKKAKKRTVKKSKENTPEKSKGEESGEDEETRE